jgi:hypothetical protein
MSGQPGAIGANAGNRLLMEIVSQGHNCWNCGGPGINHVGSTEICPKCEVLWRPYAQAVRELNTRVVYQGAVIPTIDFTKPGAPSSPA